MAFVAIKTCTFTPIGATGGVFTIQQDGLSQKSKVTDMEVCLDGLKVQVTGMTGPGQQADAATFTFTATAQKDTFDNNKPLLVNDTSDTVNVTFTQGASQSSVPITLQITDAGQTKVQAV